MQDLPAGAPASLFLFALPANVLLLLTFKNYTDKEAVMKTTQELIQKINQAFEENDMEAFMSYLSEDVMWEMHNSTLGHITLRGIEEVVNMDRSNMPEQMNFRYGTIVIEGNTAAVEGSGKGEMRNGKKYRGNFCDIYHFENEKVVRIASYVIDSIS